jgi:hypothetical protein
LTDVYACYFRSVALKSSTVKVHCVYTNGFEHSGEYFLKFLKVDFLGQILGSF